MSIVTAIADVLEKPELASVRAEALPMQRVYEQMQSQGYAQKQGYAIASMDALAGMRTTSNGNAAAQFAWL